MNHYMNAVERKAGVFVLANERGKKPNEAVARKLTTFEQTLLYSKVGSETSQKLVVCKSIYICKVY